MPEEVFNWMNIFGGSRNTRPEFIFLSSLPCVAAICGPGTLVKVREEYCEKINIFLLTLAEPGSNKSQAFYQSIVYPLRDLSHPFAKHIQVDEFSRKGLFAFLKQQSGHALLAYEEMGSFLDQIFRKQSESKGERQYFCRHFDGWKMSELVSNNRGETKYEEVPDSALCIGGFQTHQPFIEQFAQLSALKDGFADRILIAMPKPHLLQEGEVEANCSKLREEILPDLCKVYEEISTIHTGKPKV